jgi:hypothetical protein
LFGKTFGHSIDFNSLDVLNLCPNEEREAPTAIYIESHLKRISGVHIMSTIEYEYERLNQKKIIHGPTKLYALGQSRLFRGGIWTKKNEFMRRLLNSKDEAFNKDFDKAVITDSDIAHQYFGHWLHDAIPASLVADLNMEAISFKKPHYFHAEDYLNLFSLNLNFCNSGKVNSLFLLEDVSQNSYKVKRYLELRERLERNIISLTGSRFEGVFMARGKTGVKRNLNNEQAVIEHLQRKNFDIIYPESMTASEIVHRLWNAPILISVEGSAFNHGLYTIAKNGAYLVLQPPHIFNNVHKGICDALNRPYGFYVCQSMQNSDEFYVDSMDDLDRIIDGLRNDGIKRKIV